MFKEEYTISVLTKRSLPEKITWFMMKVAFVRKVILSVLKVYQRSQKEKAFAIAEIKVNKGQQFAAYEEMAKKQVKLEEEKEAKKFIEHREKFSKIITQLDDLKKMDKLTHEITSNIEEDHTKLIEEINQIKEKYNIKSWPTTESTVDLGLNEPIFSDEKEKRLYFIQYILNELMNNAKYEEIRKSIVESKLKKSMEEVSKSIQKNVVRRYLLDTRNECPVPLPQ